MKVAIISFVTGAVCAFILLASISVDVVNEYESKAVELGAAHWVVDQKTGKTTFTWKEQP